MVAEEETDGQLAAVLAGFGLLPADGWMVDHLRTMNNAVWAVSRQDQSPAWVLRRHRTGWRNREAIAAELDLLAALGDTMPESISVPQPATSMSYDRLVEAGGDVYSLLTWVPGSPRRPGSGLTADDAWCLGQGLGWIHTATGELTGICPPVDWTASTLFTNHPGLMGTDPTTLRRLLEPSDVTLFDDVAARTAAVFDHVQDWGLIHGDYILGNCNWTTVEGQSHLGILDFDDFGRGPRVFDLGAVMGNLADFPEDWSSMAPQFLDGYRSAHQLPPDSVRLLPLMMAARHTSQCLWTIGHRDRGAEWIATQLRARIQLARDCLDVTL